MAILFPKFDKKSYKSIHSYIYIYLNVEIQRIARTDKKSFLSDQCKYRKTVEWGKLAISLGKLEIPREHFMQRWEHFMQRWAQ